jgi:hypothetical protein
MKTTKNRTIKVLKKDGTPSGAWINLTLTFIYIVLIVAGVFVDRIAKNLVTLETIMLTFYASSLGIWSAKKIAGKFSSKDETEQ